jgi:hypothetical protein
MFYFEAGVQELLVHATHSWPRENVCERQVEMIR